jgi:hypothetical protein
MRWIKLNTSSFFFSLSAALVVKGLLSNAVQFMKQDLLYVCAFALECATVLLRRCTMQIYKKK